MRNGASIPRLGRAALPIIAVAVFTLTLVATLSVAGRTLGFDFLAYHQAAARLLAGQPLYDMAYTGTGGFGLFYYPPTFAPFILALGLLPPAIATWVWIGLSIVGFLLGVALLPVTRPIRWWILLLAGLSWPFVYAVKLGQVGPVLFLAFAIGWRWLDRPAAVGASIAVGAAIKLQPALLFGWALLTRRWATVILGLVILAAIAVVATALAGIGSWADFLTLVRTVSDPITTPHNFTPGAVAFQLGVGPGVAGLIQIASTVAVGSIVVVAAFRATGEASYLAAIVASQLVSPVLWDHYAMLLLIPISYLLAAGRWWAIVIPLATSLPLVGVIPPVVYPMVFWATILAVVAVGTRARSRATMLPA